MKKLIIGIAGKAGSGKDTVADILVKEHGFVKISLADVMKRFLKELFDFTDEQLWGPSEMRNTPDPRYSKDTHQIALSPRRALQQLGTEWGRAMYENVWIDYTLKTAKHVLESSALAPDGYIAIYNKAAGAYFVPIEDAALFPAANARGVVIADVRFDNELEAILSAGKEPLISSRIWRRLGRGSLEGAAAQHTSEKGLAPDWGFDADIGWAENEADLSGIVKAVLEKT